MSAQPTDALRCGRCGGPHQFDTSVPSPLWNRVIRGGGLPDFLCTTCIVLAFVEAGESFEAELYGDAVNRPDRTVPLIRVQVDDRPLDDSYGTLLWDRDRLRAVEAAARDVIAHDAALTGHDPDDQCWPTLYRALARPAEEERG